MNNKKLFLPIIIMLFMYICSIAYGQISQGGIPPSFKYDIKSDNIDLITIPQPDLTQVHYEDSKNDRKKGQYRVAVMLDVDLNMNNSGTWTDLPCGGKIWRLRIRCKGALAMNLFYKNFYIPKAGELFLYNENRKQIIGAFTDFNNTKEGWFSTELIQGDVVNLEYYQPNDESMSGKRIKQREVSIEIFQIGYCYRGVEKLISGFMDDGDNKAGFGSAAPCNVNVNCNPEGNNWQNQKRGVALTFSSGNICSGSLVNNTNNDFKPYFLTADHCEHPNPALSQFYFNYEAHGCANPPSAPSYNTMTGATFRASAPLSGGTDFRLLELNNNIPQHYNPYFSGWDRSGAPSPSGVSIHHPVYDIKKISTYTTSLISATYPGALQGGFWSVTWRPTPNGHGITELGSSGSPIFNNNKRIVGTLTAGGSYCHTPYAPDTYGKFSAHWDQNGSQANRRLRPWLDPANTNVTSLDGIDYHSSINANFSASPTTISAGDQVNFTCTSTGDISTRSWSFPGGTPTSSTSQNPTVTYNTPGAYNVSLTITGGGASDTETKTNYITVIDATSCILLNYPLAGTESLYEVQDGGYVSGNNAYGDLAKADFFENSGAKNVSSMIVHLGAVEGTSGNVEFAVWSVSAGKPGTKLGSKIVSMAQIYAAFNNPGDPFTVEFDNPILVSGNFFAGFYISTGSTFAVTTTTDGDRPNSAWEQWYDGIWYPYNHAQAWNMSLTHFIFPEICPLDVYKENLVNEKIKIFPNPATNEVSILSKHDNYKLIIYNNAGQIINKYNIKNSSKTIDTKNLSSGIYNFVIITNSEIFNKKISIIKP